MAHEEHTPFVAATETELLHRLIELNPGYLWATDRELRFTALLGRRVHQNGWTPEETYGRLITEFAGGVPEHVVDAHRRALAGECVSYEFEASERFWRARVEPLTDRDGTIVGVAGASVDTTELVHTSHELDESRAKLDLALQQLPAIFWATDTQLRLTSAAGRPIRGRRIETWIGKRLQELFGGDDHPAIAAHELALGGGSGRYELTIDGRDYDVSVQALRAQDDAIAGTVGIAVDGSERRASRRTADQLASIVLHSTDSICGMDKDGRVFCWNPAAERMFGWSAEEMLGETTDRIIPPEERAEWETLRSRALAGETSEQLAATRVRKDGSHLHVWLIRTPIRDENGEVIGFSTIARDLAHVEEAAEQRQTALKLEAVARLAGGIAQDFNNLLTAIAGNAELAGAECQEGPGREAVAAILAATERAGTLTQGLLAFSQRQLLHPQPLDLNATIADTRPLLERLLGDEAEVVLELEAQPGAVLVDPAALRQILFDLALNARDAMGDGGLVRIATGSEDGVAILRVTDTGVGMDAATRARAFDPFFTTKDPVTGGGLGLAAVHGTVLQSGGELRLDSTPGDGTTVEVRLPLAPAEPGANGDPGSPGHVLVVEDEELVRRLVVQTLEANGFTVTVAETPGQALAHIRSGTRFDVLLTDLVMPELYGDELVARVRELEPGLPAVVMSGYVNDPDAFPDTVEFLPKPFRPGELVAVVGRAVRQP
jgi:PAS domain S-box-containing protein